MKLTKLGKKVFTIYNIIISIIAYLLAEIENNIFQ